MSDKTLFTLFDRRLEVRAYWNGIATAIVFDRYTIYIVIPFFEFIIDIRP